MTTETSARPETLFFEPRYYKNLLETLAAYANGRTIWAFGSRATGKYLWRYSDLDLAVEGRLAREERSALTEAFEESLLPVKVDLVELDMVDAEFAERIRRDFVLVQAADTQATES